MHTGREGYGLIHHNERNTIDATSFLVTLATLAAEAEGAGWDGFFLWDDVTINTPIPIAGAVGRPGRWKRCANASCKGLHAW